MNTCKCKVLAGLAALAWCLQAQGNIIVALEPASQTVNLGAIVSVNLVISGLGDHTSPSLGALDLDLSYNPAILTPVSVGGLGNEMAAPPGATVGSGFPSPGVFNLYAISFESIADLQANQPASFLLAAVDFATVGPGTSQLSISGSLSDETGLTSLAFQTTGAQVEVIGGGVPVPETASTAGSLAFGLISLIAFGRKLHG